ncbi:MAG: LssY C-terminal domain-containing protein [Proteobacteria bacterium]|nr:LssY C-terminal domain-containing protein [Pseudomonadota bacterium]
MLAIVCPMPARGEPILTVAQFTHIHPGVVTSGTRSFTLKGVPGDPLNFAYIGSEEDLLRVMKQAGWFPADPITLESSLRIALDSVMHRPYVDAPVSDLYVQGRKQDLAFEQPAANNPSRRHHVRFWRIRASGLPVWMAAATYDSSIGLSRSHGHITDHVTHHIAADIDAERDKLLDDLKHAAKLSVSWIVDFQPDRNGRNGGGDPFHTDGRLVVVAVLPEGMP